MVMLEDQQVPDYYHPVFLIDLDGVSQGGPGSTQPSSFPWLAAVETLQRKQNLTRLAPKGRLIAAQPVEGIGRQVGQANKGACEVVRSVSKLPDRW
jgi:hypothetical protein